MHALPSHTASHSPASKFCHCFSPVPLFGNRDAFHGRAETKNARTYLILVGRPRLRLLQKDTRGQTFVHIRNVVDDVDNLPIGTRIAFDELPPRGAEEKPMATNVRVVTDGRGYEQDFQPA